MGRGGDFSPVPLLWLLAIDAALTTPAILWLSDVATCAVSVRYRADGKEDP
jgi:hypothetical protein